MPNGKPGDHPMIDIVHHGLNVFSERSDDLVRQIAKCCLEQSLWALLYSLYREGEAIRMAGTPGRMPISAFETFLGELLDKLPHPKGADPSKEADRIVLENRERLEGYMAA